MKKPSIPELSVADHYFAYVGTMIFDRGVEVDIFRPEDESFEYDIRVSLEPEGSVMQYRSIRLTDRQGDAVTLTGPRGGLINQEMSEVTLWEKIEKSDEAMAYYYGRPPVSVQMTEGLVILSGSHDALPDPA